MRKRAGLFRIDPEPVFINSKPQRGLRRSRSESVKRCGCTLAAKKTGIVMKVVLGVFLGGLFDKTGGGTPVVPGARC